MTERRPSATTSSTWTRAVTTAWRRWTRRIRCSSWRLHLRKDDYAQKVVPAVQDLKFRYFGHDLVILHEHEIRKPDRAVQVLRDQNLRAAFVADVTKLMRRRPSPSWRLP